MTIHANVKQRHFAPKWYFVIATLVFVALFISMGCWQLRRADEKGVLQTSFESRMHLSPLTLQQITATQDVRYYPVTVTGHYDNAHTILLDNKIYQHRIGYEVVTPFIPTLQTHNQRVVLVNRGWLAADIDRQVLPVIPDIIGQQTITGVIYQMPGKAFTLGSIAEGRTHWPLRLQALDFSLVESILQRPLYPFVVLLSPNDKEGFVRDWQPIATSVQKHIGYAVQWFTFAGVLVIIFIVLSRRGGS